MSDPSFSEAAITATFPLQKGWEGFRRRSSVAMRLGPSAAPTGTRIKRLKGGTEA